MMTPAFSPFFRASLSSLLTKPTCRREFRNFQVFSVSFFMRSFAGCHVFLLLIKRLCFKVLYSCPVMTHFHSGLTVTCRSRSSNVRCSQSRPRPRVGGNCHICGGNQISKYFATFFKNRSLYTPILKYRYVKSVESHS